jgi:hypothetical protein
MYQAIIMLPREAIQMLVSFFKPRALGICSHIVPRLKEDAAKRFDDVFHLSHNETVSSQEAAY